MWKNGILYNSKWKKIENYIHTLPWWHRWKKHKHFNEDKKEFSRKKPFTFVELCMILLCCFVFIFPTLLVLCPKPFSDTISLHINGGVGTAQLGWGGMHISASVRVVESESELRTPVAAL